MDIHVAQPWFGLIKKRLKTVEGRLNKDKFAEIKVGSLLTISHPPKEAVRHSINNKKVVAMVTHVTKYDTFQSYLEQEGLSNTLPGVDSIAKGVAVYRELYSRELELQHGVLAIRMTLLN